jgi:hypothetical protein
VKTRKKKEENIIVQTGDRSSVPRLDDVNA